MSISSKKTFLNVLAMRLFLHYSFDDTKEIIDDYAEWFESEKSTGKSEAAVCHRLNISNIIHQNVDFTRDTGKQKIASLFSNPFLLFTLFLFLQLAVNFLILMICNRNGLSFGIFALIANAVFFIIGSLITKRSDTLAFQFSSNRNLTIALGIYLLLLMAAPLALLLYSAYGSVNAAYASILGKLCVTLLLVSTLILILFVLYFLTASIFCLRRSFPVIALLYGTTSLMFYYINQLHSLYTQKSHFVLFFIFALMIFLETILFSLFFYGRLVKK